MRVPSAPEPSPVPADRLYTPAFFQCFLAVGLLMTGFSLQFHFGEYVEHLGHGVDVLGWVMSAGTLGTLAARLHIGRWIDRVGCRPVWLAGTATVAVSIGATQFFSNLAMIVALRIVTVLAISMSLTTTAVYAAAVAPPARRAESMGTMGLAGFLGMMIGPAVGDLIFADRANPDAAFRAFFSISAACGLLGGLVLAGIPLPPAPPRTAGGGEESPFRVVLRHWPGAILLVGVVTQMAFCLQMSFLERLAQVRGFHDIRTFFFVYGPTAILLRIVFRRAPERLGRTRTILGGMAATAAGLTALIGAKSESGLVLPALLMGAGHSFVFPSMVDLGADRLPPEHRGTGTATILGAGDLGMLIGFALLGRLIETHGFDLAITFLAGSVAVTGIYFGWATRRQVRDGATRVRVGEGR